MLLKKLITRRVYILIHRLWIIYRVNHDQITDETWSDTRNCLNWSVRQTTLKRETARVNLVLYRSMHKPPHLMALMYNTKYITCNVDLLDLRSNWKTKRKIRMCMFLQKEKANWHVFYVNAFPTLLTDFF